MTHPQIIQTLETSCKYKQNLLRPDFHRPEGSMAKEESKEEDKSLFGLFSEEENNAKKLDVLATVPNAFMVS